MVALALVDSTIEQDMGIFQNISEVTSHVYQTSPSAYPGLVWSFYIRYLWNYEPNSWVARISYFFRVLAILLSLPTLILGLLVSCYLTRQPPVRTVH